MWHCQLGRNLPSSALMTMSSCRTQGGPCWAAHPRDQPGEVLGKMRGRVRVHCLQQPASVLPEEILVRWKHCATSSLDVEQQARWSVSLSQGTVLLCSPGSSHCSYGTHPLIIMINSMIEHCLPGVLLTLLHDLTGTCTVTHSLTSGKPFLCSRVILGYITSLWHSPC